MFVIEEVRQFWILDFAKSLPGRGSTPPWQTFQEGFWIDPRDKSMGLGILDFGINLDSTDKFGGLYHQGMLVKSQKSESISGGKRPSTNCRPRSLKI